MSASHGGCTVELHSRILTMVPPPAQTIPRAILIFDEGADGSDSL